MTAATGRPTHATAPADSTHHYGFTAGKTYEIQDWVGDGFTIWDDDGHPRHRRDPSAWLLTTEPSVADSNVLADLDAYDAGLLSDYGGGNVDWWQDYIRAELGRAHEHYAAQFEAQSATIARLELREAVITDAVREAYLTVACWPDRDRWNEDDTVTLSGKQFMAFLVCRNVVEAMIKASHPAEGR